MYLIVQEPKQAEFKILGSYVRVFTVFDTPLQEIKSTRAYIIRWQASTKVSILLFSSYQIVSSH